WVSQRTSLNCEGPRAQITVTIIARPVISASVNSVCVGSTITLSPNTGGTWISSNPARATITNDGVVTGVSAGTVTFTFTETSTGCTNTTSTITVLAQTTFTTNPSASNLTVCSGVNNNLDIQFNPQQASGTTYSWTVTASSNVTGATSGSVNGNANNGQRRVHHNLSVNNRSSGTATYTITFTNSNLCTYSLIRAVTINP